MISASIPELKNVRTASVGVCTIGPRGASREGRRLTRKVPPPERGGGQEGVYASARPEGTPQRSATLPARNLSLFQGNELNVPGIAP